MKYLVMSPVILFAFLMAGCKPEKVVATKRQSLFQEQPSNHVTSANPFVSDNTNSLEAKITFQKEMTENSLPKSHPETTYTTWQSYNELYQTTVQNLSPLTKQYCSQLFISAYALAEPSPSTELKSITKSHLDFLIAQKFSGYKLLYQSLSWLKNCGEIDYANNLKSSILIYAKPLMRPVDPKIQDSKEVLQNENLKQELDRAFAVMKDNDSYIEKIKAF